MSQPIEARCRWIIRQEMWNSRQRFPEDLDDSFEEIYKTVLDVLSKEYASGDLPEVSVLKWLINRALRDIEKQLGSPAPTSP